MAGLDWPSSQPDTKKSEWIISLRKNIIFLSEKAKVSISNIVCWPFDENWQKRIKLDTNLLIGYHSAVIGLIPCYTNHVYEPENELDYCPQLYNPAWTLETIMANIECDELPDPQYRVFENNIWLQRMKEILDLLLWPRLEIPVANIISWNSYTATAYAKMSFETERHTEWGGTFKPWMNCFGWSWSKQRIAYHETENGRAYTIEDNTQSETNEHCDEHRQFNPPGCSLTPEIMLNNHGPELVNISYAAGLINLQPVFVKTPSLICSWEKSSSIEASGPNHWEQKAECQSIYSTPVIHLQRIPEGFQVKVFFEKTDGSVINLGTYQRQEPQGDIEQTIELENVFPEFEEFQLPERPNPAEYPSSACYEESKGGSIKLFWEIIPDNDS
jgi:hypothetical protein